MLVDTANSLLYLDQTVLRQNNCHVTISPCITWLNTVQRDFRAYKLTLNEAVDLDQNRPL